MEIRIKVIAMPGFCKKTIDVKYELKSGSTIKKLLEEIKADHEIDLSYLKNCLIIIDGEAINLEKQLDVGLDGKNELWIMPMISGG